jgi:hypothetical protein
MELGHQAPAAAALSVVPGRHGDGGDAAARRRGGDAAARSDQHRERDGAVRVWSSRAGVGLDPTRSRACSARTSFANVASNVASDSGTAVIKMLSDPVLRNLLQLAPKLVVL